MEIFDFCIKNEFFMIYRKCRKVQFLLFCQYSNSWFLKALGLNCPNKASMATFYLVKFLWNFLLYVWSITSTTLWRKVPAVRLRFLFTFFSKMLSVFPCKIFLKSECFQVPKIEPWSGPVYHFFLPFDFFLLGECLIYIWYGCLTKPAFQKDTRG